jgi:hypothetical protein
MKQRFDIAPPVKHVDDQHVGLLNAIKNEIVPDGVAPPNQGAARPAAGPTADNPRADKSAA